MPAGDPVRARPAGPSLPGRARGRRRRGVRLAVVGEAGGAFNVAAEPVLDPPELARLLRARVLPLPAGGVRAAMTLAWRLRLQPTPPGWLDMGPSVPLLDTRRAREELGWQPHRSSREAILELLDGLHGGEGAATPPFPPAARHPEGMLAAASGRNFSEP